MLSEEVNQFSVPVGHHADEADAPKGAFPISTPLLSSAYIAQPTCIWCKLLKHPAAGVRVFDFARAGNATHASIMTTPATTNSSTSVNAHSQKVAFFWKLRFDVIQFIAFLG